MEVQALAECATAWNTAERIVDEEFEADFLQGYIDLKRRVALDHLDWDLSGYQGAESDYWVDKVAEDILVTTLSVAAREEVRGADDTLANDLAAY